MPMSKKKFEGLLIEIQYDLYRKEELDLSNQDLNDEQVIELALAIRKNSYIKQVNLSRNNIGDKGAEALAKLKLQKLNVSYNRIGEKGADTLSKASIALLSLSDDEFEEAPSQEEALEEEPDEEPSVIDLENFEKLSKEIQDGSYREEALDLSNKNFGDKQIIKLVSALMKNSYVKSVDLAGNKIGDKGASVLASLQLKHLDISRNKIGAGGAQALSYAKIESLDLSGNEIGAEGAKHFSETEYVRVLSLSECNIGDAGAKAVLKNRMLRVLDLSANNITDEGVKDEEVGEMPVESSLVELHLLQNKITNVGAKYIAKHKNIEILNLGTNEIGDEGLQSFIENSKLTKLNVGQNGITGRGFSTLCKSRSLKEINLFSNNINFNEEDSLPQNSSFTKINLSYNDLDSRCEKVLQSLVSIPTLQELNLTQNNIDRRGVFILFRHKTESLKEIVLLGNPLDDVQPMKSGIRFE